MNYPLISEYTESIKAAEYKFNELTNLRPVLGKDGQPIMSSGNFSIVFKMKDKLTGKFYALKCFTKEQEGRDDFYPQIADKLKDVNSPYLVSLRYLDKELLVDTEQTTETIFPVLLMDWVEGKSLDNYLRENLDDKYALEMVAYRFSMLAQWLIPQPFTHGDLKPDNILVRADGSLVLIDYDGMYVPTMKGQKAREQGSLDFCHPQRTENDFNEHIDDFPIVSILLTLKAISINPKLLIKYSTLDELLFNCKDQSIVSRNRKFKDLLSVDEKETSKLYALFILVSGKSTLCDYLSMLNIKAPNISKYTEVTNEDLRESWTDKYGVIYSKDGTRLLKGAPVRKYKIREGTVYICDDAFNEGAEICDGNRLEEIVMPSSMKVVGNYAFWGCASLKKVTFNKTLKVIGEYAFHCCESLSHIIIPNSVFSIRESAFSGCSRVKYVSLSNNLLLIEQNTFAYCRNLETVILPFSLREIGYNAFRGCSSLVLDIPCNVKVLHGDIGCTFTISPNSQYLLIEDGVLYNYQKDTIYAFLCQYDYKTGRFISDLPKWVEKKNQQLLLETGWDFYDEWPATTIKDVDVLNVIIPNNISHIGNYAFYEKGFIKKVIIPDSVKSIGENSFYNNENLEIAFLPNSLVNYEIKEWFNDLHIDLVIPVEVADKLIDANCRDFNIKYDYKNWFRNHLGLHCLPKEELECFIQEQILMEGYLSISKIKKCINALIEYRFEIAEEMRNMILISKEKKQEGDWTGISKITLQLYDQQIEDTLFVIQNEIDYLKKWDSSWNVEES